MPRPLHSVTLHMRLSLSGPRLPPPCNRDQQVPLELSERSGSACWGTNRNPGEEPRAFTKPSYPGPSLPRPASHSCAHPLKQLLLLGPLVLIRGAWGPAPGPQRGAARAEGLGQPLS